MVSRIEIRSSLLIALMLTVQCSYFFDDVIIIGLKIVLSLGLLGLSSRRIKKNDYLLWSISMLLISLVSLLFGGLTASSVDGICKLGLSLLVSVAVSQSIRNEGDMEIALKWFVIGGLVYFILILLFQGPVDVFLNGINSAYTNGTTMNFTYVSIPVAVILSWCIFNRDSKKRYILLWILVLLMNFVSGRRKASIIPVVSLFAFYVLKTKRKDFGRLLLRLIIAAVLTVCFVIVSINNETLFRLYGYRISGLLQYIVGSADLTDGSVKSLVTRQNLISEGLNYIASSVMPIGIGNFSKIDPYVTHAHNNLIELWVTMGVWAVFVFYGYICKLIKQLIQHKGNKVAQLFLVMILLNIALDYSTTSYANVMYLSIYAIIASFVKYSKVRG